jgi:hypothetical protein
MEACSLVEVATILRNLADKAAGERHELLCRASLVLQDLGKGRPPLYDDAALVDQAVHMIETKRALNGWQAAGFVASSAPNQHSVAATRARIYPKICKRLPPKINADLNLKREPIEAGIKSSTEDPS